MADENNTNNQNQNQECLRSDWASFGKGMGKTFSGLGKSLVATAKVGVNAASDWADGKEVDNTAEKAQMKQGWKDFGHSFVDTAEDFGKASVNTVKKGVDKVDDAANRNDDAPGQAAEAEAPKAEEAKPEETAEQPKDEGFVKTEEGEYKEL